MNSKQIERYFDEQGLKSFLGCYAHDVLPKFPTQLPKSLIVNTDSSDKGGDHWLALILNKSSVFYFDSFGIQVLNENIIQYLSQKYDKVIYNNHCIQDYESISCAIFCIAFIERATTKAKYNAFINSFHKTDLTLNDHLVHRMLRPVTNH